MLAKLSSVIVLLCCILSECEQIPAERITYDGFKLYSVSPEIAAHSDFLLQLQKIHSVREEGRAPKLDFLHQPNRVNRTLQVLVSGSFEKEFANALTLNAIRFKVLEQNVQRLINEEIELAESRAHAATRAADSDFRLDQYHSHDEINAFLKALSNDPVYKTRVSLEKIGFSYEGRHLLALKIGKPGTNKPSIFIDAGIHAREWIAPATTLYIIDILTSKYGSDSSIANYVDKIDWYILPSVNPDGYEYSRNIDRFWRKTRSRQSCDWWKCCYGADGNRNFDYHFGTSGVSNDSCSDLYPGPSAFSEQETKSISQFITKNKATLKAYISFHAFGQLILIPYGDKDPAEYPSDFQELLATAQEGAASLERVHGTKYTVGNIVDIIYAASGSSADWIKYQGVKYSYGMELRPDSGAGDPSGFALPPSQIIPTAEETFEAIKRIADKVLLL